MTYIMTKTESRTALAIALRAEGRAQVKLGHMEMMQDSYAHLSSLREAVRTAKDATREAIDAFAVACEEATRAGIIDWIAAAPGRMAAQKAAGAVSIHPMYDEGLLAAASQLYDGLKNRADLEPKGSR